MKDWIFSMEDRKKRRYTVNWEDQSFSHPTEKRKTEEHELMIDSGCFGHVYPPWFAPQFPTVSSTNVEAVAGNNVTLQHSGQKSGLRTRDDKQRKTNFDPDHICHDERAQASLEHFCTETSWPALKHRGVTIIFNHAYDRIIFEMRQ